MSKPAARIGDMHVCPMVTPGTPPIPHVGGPIIGPGAPTVMICSMPAAVMGDMCTCVGPPSTIVLGSMGVMIMGKPAARMGDICAHGGTIVMGAPTVLIGEMSPGAPGAPIIAGMMGAIGKGIGAVIEFLAGGLDTLTTQPSSLGAPIMLIGQGEPISIIGDLSRAMGKAMQGMAAALVPDQPGILPLVVDVINITNAMNEAAAEGTGLIEQCGK